MASISLPRPPSAIHLEDALNRISLFGLAYILGFASASAYDKVPELWQTKAKYEHAEKMVIPALKKQAAQVPVLKHEVARAKATAFKAKADRDAVLEEVGAPIPRDDPPSKP